MSDTAIIGYCRACGKPLDHESSRAAQGTIYCSEHVPVTVTVPPALTGTTSPGQTAFGATSQTDSSGQSYIPPSPGTARPAGASPFPTPVPAPAASSGTPLLAFFLGFIPGVGAVFNGQYAKGLVHVLIMGSLISILANDAAGGFEPLFGLLLGCFVFYMAFEAYHTAQKRQHGLQVDEFSSLIPMRGGSRFPILAVLLIGFGILFLLGNLGLLEFHRVLRYWPAILILLGGYMLYERMAHHDTPSEHQGVER